MRENHAEPHERPVLTATLTLSDAFLTGRTSTKPASILRPDGLTAPTTPGRVFPRSCSHSAFHHPCDQVIPSFNLCTRMHSNAVLCGNASGKSVQFVVKRLRQATQTFARLRKPKRPMRLLSNLSQSGLKFCIFFSSSA